jgi:multisubunit Na+/H+ antiporter MnhB subunit
MRKLIIGVAFVLASSMAFAQEMAGAGGAAAGAGSTATGEGVTVVNTVLIGFGVFAVVVIIASGND